MRLSFRPWTAAAAGTLLSLGLSGCGGEAETPTAATSPSPVAAQPTPTPTPAPTPTPTPNPLGLAAGPVASVKAYVKTIESPTRGSGNFRNVQKNDKDEFVLYVGEYVVLDSTQRNAAGQICAWRKDPYYSWDNFDDMMTLKGSSDPFFFKFEVARPGYAEVVSVVDGVESNVVKVRGVRP
jgi:hypothetical protein